MTHQRVLAIADTRWNSTELIQQAADWARAKSAKLEICIFPWLSDWPRSLALLPDHHVVRHLGEMTERALGSAEGLELTVDRGSSASSIVAHARATSAELVVMQHPASAHHHRQTAIRALRTLDRPMLLARRSPRTGRVVAASDLTDPRYPALQSAWEIAQRKQWELTTIHCADNTWDLALAAPLTSFDLATPVFGPSRNTGLGSLKHAHEKVGIRSESRAIVAPPPAAAAILDALRELDAELLVMGAHRRSLLRRLVLGSTCASVVCRALCSVLIVPLAEA